MAQIKKLTWSEIVKAPNKPGVYAWYYEPKITKFDIEEALIAIRAALAKGNRIAAEKTVNKLLNDHVLNYFRHDNYEATLSGPLNPRYIGTMEHDQKVSSSLVARMLEDPERLCSLCAILEKSAPYFASPIYIGMSERLRLRLTKHRDWIIKFRDQGFHNQFLDDDSDDEEAGFARRVVKRGIAPSHLFVMILETPVATDLHVDTENLLNRIYYPILGRN